MDWPFLLLDLLLLLCEIALFVVFLRFLLFSYRYIRALIKRGSLWRRLRRIAKDKGYSLTRRRGFYLSVFRATEEAELTLKAKGKIFSIKLFACLKRKATYVLTGINSYYTKNNFNPIFGILRTGRHRVFLPVGRFAQPKNDFITEIKERKEPPKKADDGKLKILCLSPVPVSIEAVHTNRPEPLFDGDVFFGHTVFSGNALCEFLRNGCPPLRSDREV